MLNFILQALFQSAQNIYEKREGFGAKDGSVTLTNGSGSGSGRPKNMWILQIRFRIRIPNTGKKDRSDLANKGRMLSLEESRRSQKSLLTVPLVIYFTTVPTYQLNPSQYNPHSNNNHFLSKL
jgi:hypothetical protein